MRMESDFVIHCGRLYERSQSALLHFFQELGGSMVCQQIFWEGLFRKFHK